jgi:hypothetical protein
MSVVQQFNEVEDCHCMSTTFGFLKRVLFCHNYVVERNSMYMNSTGTMNIPVATRKANILASFGKVIKSDL